MSDHDPNTSTSNDNGNGNGTAPDNGHSSTSPYTGTDNLDVMESAHNYNDFLTNLVIGSARGNRWLDFGAGTGTFARRIAASGHAVHCVEADRALRQRLDAAGLPSVDALSAITDRSIDFAYSLNVLEHIADDTTVLKELHRCLGTDGRLLIYVPAFMLLYSAMDTKVGHFRRYRQRDLCEKLVQSGFDVRFARYADSIGFFVSLLYKLVGSRSGDIGQGSVAVYDRWIFPVSRWLDHIVGRFFGKNLIVVAEPKPIDR